MYVQHQRVFLGWVEIRRFDYLLLYFLAAHRVIPDLFGRSEPDALEHIVIHSDYLLGRRVGQGEHRYIAVLIGIRQYTRRQPMARDRCDDKLMIALGDLAWTAAANGLEIQILGPLVFRREVQAFSIGRPDHIGRRAVETVGQGSLAGAIDAHHIELADGVGIIRPVVAGICNQLTVGRYLGARVGARAVG